MMQLEPGSQHSNTVLLAPLLICYRKEKISKSYNTITACLFALDLERECAQEKHLFLSYMYIEKVANGVFQIFDTLYQS